VVPPYLLFFEKEPLYDPITGINRDIKILSGKRRFAAGSQHCRLSLDKGFR
jgi:hypothetical protein